MRLRMIVAIPLSLTLFSLASGFLTLRLSHRFFTQPQAIPLEESRILLIESLWVLAISAMALMAGIIMAYAIVEPIKHLITRTREITPADPTKPQDLTDTEDEIKVLTTTFNHMFSYMKSHALEQQILENLTQGIITIASDGTIIDFNPVAEKILGIKSQIPNPKSQILFSENKEMLNLISKALEEERSFPFQEMTILNRQGERVLVGGNISVLKERRKGEEEKFIGIAVTLSDLAEEKRIREDLRRTDQLAALGSLATGLAHEIRNPLGSLQGIVDLLKEDTGEEDPKAPYYDTILRTVKRLNNLVEELLGFSQPGSTSFKSCDINKILKEALFAVKYSFPDKDIEVVDDLGDTLNILADIEKLHQAFFNIIQNAFQSTPNQGKIMLSTYPQGIPGNLISITNSGSYIPPEDREKIFTPFFTTRREGTGLGLSIAHQIIAAHSGTISVESDPEKGTTFLIYLPTNM